MEISLHQGQLLEEDTTFHSLLPMVFVEFLL